MDVTTELWKNRTIELRCASCMWYVEKTPSTTLGRCRRRAPTLNGWPAVFTGDWCGDHKLDETKMGTTELRPGQVVMTK